MLHGGKGAAPGRATPPPLSLRAAPREVKAGGSPAEPSHAQQPRVGGFSRRTLPAPHVGGGRAHPEV
eukprot:5844828-Prymnesium_polylepis.1